MHFRRACMGLLIVAAAQAGVAHAQTPPASEPGSAVARLLGAWSWQSPGQGGMNHDSLALQADGSYVHVGQLPNGSMFRYWGTYRATAGSRTRVRLQLHTVGWLPTAICTQIAGFGRRCGSTPHPSDQSFEAVFVGADVLQVEGVAVFRDPAAYLLQRQVPETFVQNGRTPTQPAIAQPHAPGGARYQSPGISTPGLGGNCDNLQQQRICTVNGGNMYRDNRGCQVCAGP